MRVTGQYNLVVKRQAALSTKNSYIVFCEMSAGRIICILLVDVLAIGLLYGATYVESYLPSGKKRGFTCNDMSLKYPYVPTVAFGESTLKVFSFVVPILHILLCEIMMFIETLKRERRYSIWQHYKTLRCLGFGYVMVILTENIANSLVKRLGPNFYDLCAPAISNGTECEKPLQYYTDFNCTKDNAVAKDITNGTYYTFISHASCLAFFISFFLAFYLDIRLRTYPHAFSRWFSKDIFGLITVLSYIFCACFAAMLSIQSYNHYESDVLYSCILGGAIAYLTTKHFLPNEHHEISDDELELEKLF